MDKCRNFNRDTPTEFIRDFPTDIIANCFEFLYSQHQCELMSTSKHVRTGIFSSLQHVSRKAIIARRMSVQAFQSQLHDRFISTEKLKQIPLPRQRELLRKLSALCPRIESFETCTEVIGKCGESVESWSYPCAFELACSTAREDIKSGIPFSELRALACGQNLISVFVVAKPECLQNFEGFELKKHLPRLKYLEITLGWNTMYFDDNPEGMTNFVKHAHTMWIGVPKVKVVVDIMSWLWCDMKIMKTWTDIHTLMINPTEACTKTHVGKNRNFIYAPFAIPDYVERFIFKCSRGAHARWHAPWLDFMKEFIKLVNEQRPELTLEKLEMPQTVAGRDFGQDYVEMIVSFVPHV